MTRKRKNVEESATPSSTGGYQPASTTYRPAERTFPKKGKDDDFNADHFNKQYGYVGGGGATEVLESALTEPTVQKETPFPTEIVNYLRNINTLKETEGTLEDMVYEKCVEECAGEEATLLSFRESCIAVENVFGSCALGAASFLCGLGRLKHKRLLDLLFAGCAARTIERLVYTMHPISTNPQIEILSKFVDLLCDQWSEAVCSQPSAYLLRCLARVTCGLPAKPKQEGRAPVPTVKASFSSPAMQTELRRLFDRLADLAVDPVTTGVLLDNSTCSLVVQDILEADSVAHAGKASAFVNRAVTAAQNKLDPILSSWNGRESSRVWECAVSTCAETARRAIWELGMAEKVHDIAFHPSANFPFQRLIASIYAEDLATEVCEKVNPLIADLIKGQRTGIVIALIKCTGRHEKLQEALIKLLRAHFNANKVSTKEHFLFNVLSLNTCDVSNFDVETSTYLGSLMLDALFSLSKIKTLSAGISALTQSQILAMSKHKIAAHVIQSALKSPTMEEECKRHILAGFEDRWEELIANPIGSHTFDAIWDSPLMDVNKKLTLMKSFVPIRNDHKCWRFAMLRCDMMLFRKDKKKWVEKQKKWKTFEKGSKTNKK